MFILSWIATFYGDSTVKIRFTSGHLPNLRFGLSSEEVNLDINAFNKKLDEIRVHQNTPIFTIWIRNQSTNSSINIPIDLSKMPDWHNDLGQVVDRQASLDISEALRSIGITALDDQ